MKERKATSVQISMRYKYVPFFSPTLVRVESLFGGRVGWEQIDDNNTSL